MCSSVDRRGVSVVYAYFGRASLHLVVPRDRTIELSANGQVLSPTSSAGRHVTFSLPQGIYDVAVKDKARRGVRVLLAAGR
ncbi:hypothetical protein [Archangium lansingense]|uniref:Serine/threonine protein kinase n=1 Tax=Archangium lansingense TaxID=2995310 RepID=A0ABT4A217_9BACT|nr:hypothetical protein [Archangium lansinium]MCY1075692.1 hypothetical protein [Archangium lansinium]